MVEPLTVRQREVLEFVASYIDTYGNAPLLEEIGEALGVKSKATIHEHLEQLEQRGYIEREARKRRSILIKPLNGEEPEISPLRTLARRRGLDYAKRAVYEASTFDQAYQELLAAHLLTLTRARSVCIHVVDGEREDGELLVPEIWQGCWDGERIPRSFTRNQGIAGHVWATRETYVSRGSVQKDRVYLRSGDPRAKNVQTLLVIPFFDANDEVIGTISLESNIPDRFSERLIADIEQMVWRVTGAVEALRWLERTARNEEPPRLIGK